MNLSVNMPCVFRVGRTSTSLVPGKTYFQVAFPNHMVNDILISYGDPKNENVVGCLKCEYTRVILSQDLMGHIDEITYRYEEEEEDPTVKLDTKLCLVVNRAGCCPLIENETERHCLGCSTQ